MFLRAEDVTITFGGVHANKDVNVSFDKGRIVGLIGPNMSANRLSLKRLLGLTE